MAEPDEKEQNKFIKKQEEMESQYHPLIYLIDYKYGSSSPNMAARSMGYGLAWRFGRETIRGEQQFLEDTRRDFGIYEPYLKYRIDEIEVIEDVVRAAYVWDEFLPYCVYDYDASIAFAEGLQLGAADFELFMRKKTAGELEENGGNLLDNDDDTDNKD